MNKKTARDRKDTNNNGNNQQQIIRRALAVIEYLCLQGPSSTTAIATAFKIHERTVRRVMAALDNADVPVYLRQSPRQRTARLWVIDGPAFRDRFTPKEVM